MKYFFSLLKDLRVLTDIRHCEERSDEAIHNARIRSNTGLLRGVYPDHRRRARNDAKGVSPIPFIFISLVGIAMYAYATPPTPYSAAWEFQSRLTVLNTNANRLSVGFALLELPSEFFSYLKPDLSDLRIISNEGRTEIPYRIAAEEARASYQEISARMLNLSSIPDQETSFIVDIGTSGTIHNRISIQTRSENFRRIVIVEGSDDRSSWQILTSRGQIFDYTVRDIKSVIVRDTSVRYPDATFRYLRVRIQDQGETPLKINGVDVSRYTIDTVREITYTPFVRREENTEEQSTDITLDLETQGIPHRRALVETSGSNFHRAVGIYESNDKEKWNFLGFGYIFSVNTEKVTGKHLEISYPESRARYIRFSILNRDDQPIAVEKVSLFGVARNIIFKFDPNQTYSVYLKNPKVKRPQYDIEFISQYLDASVLPRATAGSIEKNPYYRAPIIAPKPITERIPYLLPTILGGVVLLFGFLLYRIVRTSLHRNSLS